MYQELVEITPENVTRLAYLSDKYLVHRLKRQCIDFFKRNVLTAANALDFIEFRQYLIPDIHDAILTMIQTHPCTILQKDHRKVTLDTLRQVLEKDFLNCTEFEAFTICQEWAYKKCADRHQPVLVQHVINELADVLSLIRYPVMNAGAFAKVSVSNLLSPEARCKVFEYIHYGRYVRRGDDPSDTYSLPFSNVPRTSYCYYQTDSSGYNKIVTEVYFRDQIAEHPDQPLAECVKGCLVFQAPADSRSSLLGFRLQLNELMCPSYKETPVNVKVMIRRARHERGSMDIVCINENIDIRPKLSVFNSCRYHEASLKAELQLVRGVPYEVLIECDTALYYHPARGTVLLSSAPLGRPGLAIDIPSTQTVCAVHGAVGDLIRGIKFCL